MRLLDREILRCEGKIPQFAPSAQLRGKLLYSWYQIKRRAY